MGKPIFKWRCERCKRTYFGKDPSKKPGSSFGYRPLILGGEAEGRWLFRWQLWAIILGLLLFLIFFIPSLLHSLATHPH